MANKKQWWIKLVVPEWERDVNVLSLEAEGALLKLIFKLEDSPTRGCFTFAYDLLTRLFKTTPENTQKILQELAESRVLDMEFLEQNRIKISSRRILREAAISAKRSVAGKKGGESKKQSTSKPLANDKQTPYSDSNYNSEYNSEKEVGGLGEETNVRNLELNEMLIEQIQMKYPDLDAKEFGMRMEQFFLKREAEGRTYENQNQIASDLQYFLNNWNENEKNRKISKDRGSGRARVRTSQRVETASGPGEL